MWQVLRRQRMPAMAMGALLPACVENLDKPDPPDMAAIVALYTEPTADLTADNIDELQRELGRRLQALHDLCVWDDDAVRNYCAERESCSLCSGLDPMHETFQAVSSDSEGSSEVRRWIVGLDGFVRVVRSCPGWGAQPSRDLENGYTELVLGFNAQGFDPVFGGQIVGCRVSVGGERATVEGDLELAFDQRFRLNELKRLEPIVVVRGRIIVGAAETAFQANFRVSAVGGGDLALGFEVGDDGTMVATAGLSGLGVLAANGRFACELPPPDETTLQCVNLASGEVVP